jgi:PKD repeat protein
LKVHFTSETTGDPTSYFWVFEPQTSSDWNSHHAVTASHTFQNPGIYDISLTVSNSAGSSSVDEPHYITVLASPTDTPTDAQEDSQTDTQTPTPRDTQTPAQTNKPTATFSADVTEGYAPLKVHFTSVTTGEPTSYFWVFEPQSSSDWNSHHSVTASHTFQNPGLYDISLTVTNSVGSSSIDEPHYITVLASPTDKPIPNPTPELTLTPTQTQKPVASFIADATSGNAPLAVTFTDTSTGGVPKSRNWNFGDSFYSEDGPTITHTFTKPGTYTVALTVTNDAGSDMESKNNFVIVAKAPTDHSESTSEPTTTSRPKSANINLHSTKTTVCVGEEMHDTLSVVNLINKPIMHAQVILIPPSGTSVTSSHFVQSSGGQYTATYDINPGTGKDIEVGIVANQAGNFNVEGRVYYYFGNNKNNVEDYPLDLPILATGPQPTVTPTVVPPTGSPHIPDLGAGSLVLILMTAFILKRDKK